jgi:polysaccharide biosynthesis protein PslH
MNILFLSRWFPYPADNGSKIRIRQILTALATSHKVMLLSFSDQRPENLDSLAQKHGLDKIDVVLWKPYEPNSSKAKLGFFSPTPRSIIDTYSDQMEKSIRDLLSKQNFDLLIASQLSMASYYNCFSGKNALLEELELGIFYERAVSSSSLLKRLRHTLTWFKLRQYLSNLLNHFHACTVVSDEEKKLLTRYVPSFQSTNIEIIQNCIELNNYSSVSAIPSANQIIFTGSFRYHANYEAMLWFVRHVYPIIRESLPETQLIITGDHANMPFPPTDGVVLAGFVDDINKYIKSSWVSIAPLWSGGGTRLKILEAMGLGTPVVSTTKGAEGLDAQPGEHLLIADTAETFANHVLAILRDKPTHDRLALQAKEFVKNKYNWDLVLPRFLGLVERIGKM